MNVALWSRRHNARSFGPAKSLSLADGPQPSRIRIFCARVFCVQGRSLTGQITVSKPRGPSDCVNRIDVPRGHLISERLWPGDRRCPPLAPSGAELTRIAKDAKTGSAVVYEPSFAAAAATLLDRLSLQFAARYRIGGMSPGSETLRRFCCASIPAIEPQRPRGYEGNRSARILPAALTLTATVSSEP